MKELILLIRKTTKEEFTKLHEIFKERGYGDGVRRMPIFEECVSVIFDNPNNKETGKSTFTITRNESVGQLIDDIKKVTGEL